MEKRMARDYIAAADTKGYIMLIPQTKADRNCWDVGSPKSLKHDGGGDSHVLATMIKYTLQKYNGDKTKVFITGTSSGAMMTNVMAAVYPDLFNAGAAFSGVAAGCFDHSTTFNPINANKTCTDGKVHKTGAEWGAQVRSFYPGYTGSYPRMSIWHGTADNLIYYPVMKDMMLEWSELLGVQWTKNETDSPQKGYTKMVYGDGTKLVGYSAQGVGHTVPQHGKQVLEWWGI
jgi:acetylxylan esterase